MTVQRATDPTYLVFDLKIAQDVALNCAGGYEIYPLALGPEARPAIGRFEIELPLTHCQQARYSCGAN